MVDAVRLRAGRKRQAQRQEVSGNRPDRPVRGEPGRLFADPALNLADRLPLVPGRYTDAVEIVGDLVAAFRDLVVEVHPEVRAHGVSAHRPTDVHVELRQPYRGDRNRPVARLGLRSGLRLWLFLGLRRSLRLGRWLCPPFALAAAMGFGLACSSGRASACNFGFANDVPLRTRGLLRKAAHALRGIRFATYAKKFRLANRPEAPKPGGLRPFGGVYFGCAKNTRSGISADAPLT